MIQEKTINAENGKSHAITMNSLRYFWNEVKYIADQSIDNTMRQIKAVSRKSNNILWKIQATNDQMPLNKLPIFPDLSSKHVSQSKKCNCWKGFFAYENQDCPPFLSDGGK